MILSDNPQAELAADDSAAVRKLHEAREKILQQLSQVIVGQNQVIEELLISLFSRGHLPAGRRAGVGQDVDGQHAGPLLEPVVQPRAVHARPDAGRHHRHGNHRREQIDRQPRIPLPRRAAVSHIVILADEINRTPPKTQAALLEAMQERQVTVGRVRHPLFDPFFVLATQNPIEQEGTYPLPEAQQDRFMFKVFVKYPNFGEEFEIARRTTSTLVDQISAGAVGGGDLRACSGWCAPCRSPTTSSATRLSLVRQTRVGEPGVPEFVSDQVSWGAGPRAVQFLILGAKTRALLHGRTHVSTEDIQALAKPVLRHRLVLNFAAESEGVTPDDVVEQLIETTPTKEDELTHDARFQKIFAS